MTSSPNWNESRKRSVDNLQRIYSFVVSLAVAEGLRRTLTNFPAATLALPPPEVWMHLVVILATIVPFYHGASRYLDAAYVTGERASVRYALLLDFLFLFAESILLFSLSLLIYSSSWFYVCFAILLAMDVIWVITTRFTTRVDSTATEKKPNIVNWAVINIITIFLVLFLYWTTITEIQVWKYAFAPPSVLALIAVVRSVLDYYIMWPFYYPEAMMKDDRA